MEVRGDVARPGYSVIRVVFSPITRCQELIDQLFGRRPVPPARMLSYPCYPTSNPMATNTGVTMLIAMFKPI